MSIEANSYILFGLFFIGNIVLMVIYNEIILPTIEQHGEDGNWNLMPTGHLKQISTFLKISKENNIHPNARRYIKFFLFGGPVIILVLVIVMISQL